MPLSQYGLGTSHPTGRQIIFVDEGIKNMREAKPC